MLRSLIFMLYHGYTLHLFDCIPQIDGDARLFRVLVLLRVNTNGTVTR
jgi:hypothetical protein